MIKDPTRDYVIAMFRLYSLYGKPSVQEIKEKRNNYSSALYFDLFAVARTMEELQSKNKQTILNAVRDVYFTAPDVPLRKNDITLRVVKFSVDNYIHERNVWKYLQKACKICAKNRNLNIEL